MLARGRENLPGGAQAVQQGANVMSAHRRLPEALLSLHKDKPQSEETLYFQNITQEDGLIQQ